jgi:hypothetical protein
MIRLQAALKREVASGVGLGDRGLSGEVVLS